MFKGELKLIMTDVKRFTSTNSMKTLVVQCIVTLTLALSISLFMYDTWIKNLNTYHTVLELICVFIALSIFFLIWYTYRQEFKSNHVLGFGFLSVAIYDSLHIFYHLKLNLTQSSYFDMSTRYWILGRLTEAIVLLLSVHALKIKLNKLTALILTLAVTFGASYFVLNHHDSLPILLTKQGVTPIKVFLEYIIISIYLLSLYKLKDKINDKGIITYKFIFMSLLMSVSSELCFTLYSSVSSFSWTAGHILKIASYYLLFKGTFASTVIYPYEKLEVQHEELENANKELGDVSQTLNDVIDALPIAVLKYDFDGKLRYVNKKFEELLSYDRSALYGLKRSEILGMISEYEGEIDDEVFESETSKLIKSYRTLNGDNIKLSLNSHRISNGVLVLINDVKIEQELKNLHIQTETILNTVSNCVLMADSNKRIILCNKALEDTYEMNREDIIGKSIDELNNLIDFSSKELSDLVLKGDFEKQYYEVSLTTIKGNKKQLMLYLAPIKNVDGEIIGSISVSTDITELKKEQEKMIQQEKLALLGQMGAGIVHETRNYLTTIKGRCQLIGLVSQDEKAKEHAQKINKEIDEINKIISEFLFLSKPKETELEEVSMLDIFESIKSIVEATSLVKGVDVDFKLSREERYLLCDEGQLKQVILNICKNAVEAMADTISATLKVETGYDEVTNEMFIRIKDNGKGISDDDLKKIGTPFFTTKKSGTGLGLNVCYNIIKEHKGRIDIESKIGEGTTFTVTLPCIDDEELDEVV
jgi:PAS domain S-box-containing protein